MSFSLVGRTSLDVLPLVDEVLSSRCDGERVRSISERGAIWCNRGPRQRFDLSPEHGFESLVRAREFFSGELASVLGSAERAVEGTLMPGGMHPWFRAERAEAWPHEAAPADRAMHMLFGARRHGWANQQALTLSIPFASEAEFKILFAALRFLEPLMPVLSAASPVAEGAIGPARQCRVAARSDLLCSLPAFAKTSVQRHVPPAMDALGAYQSLVVQPLEAALASHGVSADLGASDVCASGLWVDSNRGAIDIRLLDGQECVAANVAICASILALTTHLAFNSAVPTAELDAWPSPRLDELVQATIVEGERAVVRDSKYLHAWGFPEGTRCRASELLQFLWEDKLAARFDEELKEAAQTIVFEGPLASRIAAALPRRFDEEMLWKVYRNVVNCLAEDTMFRA